jgi:hypothetical protein
MDDGHYGAIGLLSQCDDGVLMRSLYGMTRG